MKLILNSFIFTNEYLTGINIAFYKKYLLN